MPVVAKRYKVRFEEGSLRFSESYPTALEGILPLAEFDSVVRKVNEDLTTEVRETNENIKKWAIATISLCVVVIGLFLTPVLFVKTKRQKRELKVFWEKLRNYLGEINRKVYLKRNLEWKVVEDKKKLKGRDVVNPMFAYRIEIIHRITKAKQPRQGGPDASMTSIAAGSSRGSGSGTMLSSSPGVSSSSKSKSQGAGMVASGGPLGEPKNDEENADTDSDDFEQGEEVLLEEPSYQPDDIILEEEDEDDFADDDAGNLASISSVGAGSYSRGSLILTPAALAVAASQERRESIPPHAASPRENEAMPVEFPEPSEGESLTESSGIYSGQFPAKKGGKPGSKVRFSGLFENDDEETAEERDDTTE